MPPDFGVERLDPVSEMELDPENPRLPRRMRGATQPDLRKIMIERFDVASLAEAIISAGWLEQDPVAGYRNDSGIVRVREGNRRLAAVQMLLEPSLAPERYRDVWDDLHQRLSQEVADDLRTISVQVWADKDAPELAAYIGYRHVTGIRPWPPVEKAAFIADLVENHGLDYRQISQRIGSKPRHVERHFIAYRLVEQAYAEEVPGADRMNDSFGVLMRALQARGIPEFLGISYTGNIAEAMQPAPPNSDELAEFTRWTFGTEDRSKILPDSRDVTRLGRILSSPEALGYLRRTAEPSFEKAWERSGGESETLATLLFEAADRLRDAVPIFEDHLGDEDVARAFDECRRFFRQLDRATENVEAAD